MNAPAPEELLALGTTFLLMFVVFGFLALAMMSWTLQFAAGLISDTKPSFIGCFGMLLGIAAVNGIIAGVGTLVLNPENLWMITPLTWFATVYMVAKLADCGLIRAFFIWILNSVFATLGFIALFAMMIPLAMIGGVGANGEQTAASQPKEITLGKMESNFTMEETDSFPEIRNTSFGSSRDSDEAESSAEDASSAFFASEEETQSQNSPKQGASRQTAKPRRAQDGTTLNPFFNQ
ncbi:MAG: hypothetical protein AAFX06_05770 [Planctomycetota bacterium]